MKIFIIFFLLVTKGFAQELDTSLFLSNIKEKIFKIKDFDGNYRNIYIDLDRKSVTEAQEYIMDKKLEEQFPDFSYQIFNGSFLNKLQKEYIFVIRSGYYTAHVENGGLTTFLYIFDKNYNQISERAYQYADEEIIDIVDVDNDGINEIITNDTYGQMGFVKTWINVYSKDLNFNQVKVVIPIYFNSDASGIGGREYINVESDYRIEKSSLIIDSRLDYYVCMGRNENSENDNRFMKSEIKHDIFEYKKGKFKHIINKENVNWDDYRLEF